MNNIFLIIGMLIIPFSIMDICTFNGVKIKDRANNLGYYIVCFIVFGASLVRDPLVGSDSFNNYNSFIRIYNGERPYPKLFNAIVDLFQSFSLNYMPFLYLPILLF